MRIALAPGLLVSVVALALSGCGVGDIDTDQIMQAASGSAPGAQSGRSPSDDGAPDPDEGEGAGSWTILVYVAADAEVEGGVDLTLSFLESGSAGAEGVTIAVLVDRESTEGTTVYEIRDGATRVVEERGEENTADPAVLEAFVTFGLTDYPADHAALFVKGSGFGWRGIGLDRVGPEEADLMGCEEIADAVAAARAAAGRPVDLIALEGSTMGMIEVAYELRDAASYLVTTQTKIQEDGLPYELILNALARDPGMDGAALGAAIVDAHIEYYAPRGNRGVPAEDTSTNFAALAVHDLGGMEELFAAHSAFASELGACMPHVRNVVPHARDRSMVGGFGAVTESDYQSDMAALILQLDELLVDFDYEGLCPGLPEAMESFLATYEDVLVAEMHADKFRWVTHGLSVWYPPTENKYMTWADEEAFFIEAMRYDDETVGLDFVLGDGAYWLDYLFIYFNATFHAGE